MGELKEIDKVTKGKIERESLAFGGGCITSTGSGSYEVRYYLRDHLGSVRAVRTASGRIVEENAYYPFGLRQRRQDYAVSGNRYRYNGHEEQQTFGYLDYGFRMYDACLGRWHSSDPLSERDPGISGYAYVKNAPLRYRDILGLTYTGYGDVPPYKYRWTPDGYELEEVVVTAPRGGSGYAFPILGAMGYSRQSGALWRTVFTWERYFESASDLRSVYGNASPNTSYDAPGPHSLHPDSHIPSGGGGSDSYWAWALAATGVIIADDLTGIGIADDIAIPFILGGAYILDRLLNPNLKGTTGNVNYPGPWVSIYQHPSQSPLNTVPRGFDPNEPPFNMGRVAKWVVSWKLLYELYDEYQNYINRYPSPVIRVDKTYVAPKYYPYGER